jgi:hypothetical protein
MVRLRRVCVLRGVVLDMVLGGLCGVVFGLHVMAVGQMSVVTRFLVIARFVVFRGKPVVLGGVFVMLRCLAMMFGALLRHGSPLLGVFSTQLLFSIEHTRIELHLYVRKVTAG